MTKIPKRHNSIKIAIQKPKRAIKTNIRPNVANYVAIRVARLS